MGKGISGRWGKGREMGRGWRKGFQGGGVKKEIYGGEGVGTRRLEGHL